LIQIVQNLIETIERLGFVTLHYRT